jgi:pyruvate kinase
MSRTFTPEFLSHPIAEVERLRDEALKVEAALADDIERAHPVWRASARNLAHYVALRNRDLRALQHDLSPLGLSSLGRAEAHALASIEAVLGALYRLDGRSSALPIHSAVEFESGVTALEAHTRALIGPRPSARTTRIMVTMPSEAADDPNLVHALVEAGMDCARINCAHDDPERWERIARHTRSAAESLGRTCNVLMDLPGPKLRTARLPEGPRALHLRPPRGPRGELLQPLRVVVFTADSPSSRELPAHDARIPVEGEDLDRFEVGDVLCLTDLRGRDREFQVVARGVGFLAIDLDASVWLETGIALQVERGGARAGELRVGLLPPVESPLELRRGDTLWVVPEDIPARPKSTAGPARIGCTLMQVFRDACAGESIHFDDGKISGRIRDVVRAGSPAPRLEVEITAVAGKGKLGGDKGINLPNTRFRLPALTDADAEILPHVARLADMVGMSFVHEPDDILELQQRLDALARRDIGVVLKIETARAFQNLPRLILTGMRSPPVGVMVARGDLGVELGFERLAEVQEEILWLCEAAHIPVIWATQVLEALANRGQPSRAEVTDAAMSARAECVMLNKGPYVLDAVRFLDDVLRRMQHHQHKKSSMLRRLSVCGLADAALRSAPARSRPTPDIVMPAKMPTRDSCGTTG